MKNIQACLLLFLLLIIFLVSLSSSFQNINSQTLDQYEFQENYSRYQIPSIKVGNNAIGIAVDENTGKIYVTNADSNSLSIININNMEIKTVRVGAHPSEILIDNSLDYVYVLNGDSHSISVIDRQNDTKIKEISIGGYINDLVISVVPHRIYVANKDSSSIFVFDGYNHSIIDEIPIGKGLGGMDVHDLKKKLYVVNSTNVIVFDTANNTKIKEIPVGTGASDIIVDDLLNHKAYVTNFIEGEDFLSLKSSISILNLEQNKKIKEISGSLLVHNVMAEDLNLMNMEYIYVRNDNSTISVLSGSDFHKINEIQFNDVPLGLIVDYRKDLVYMHNSLEYKLTTFTRELKKISEISTGFISFNMDINRATGVLYLVNANDDTIAAFHDSNVVAGVAFNINPADSGFIKCNNINFPTNQYLFVEKDTKCIAESNKNFQFSSWVENFGKSIRTLNVSTFTDSPLHSVSRALGIENNDTSKIFTVNNYGNFTANFIEVTPPIPNEYLFPLYGIIASTIIGWSIPSIIGWIKWKREIGKLNFYHNRIKVVYDDEKLDEKDIEHLEKLRDRISDAYSKGKINSEHYSNLKDEISILYQEIFKKRIQLLSNVLNKEDMKKIAEKIKDDIDDAYSKAKLNELHYDLLKEKISKYENNNNNNSKK